ncbi:MAG: FtsX-like permease family protein [Cellulomonadaceae bacterium]
MRTPALWWLLRRRSRGADDAAALTGLLAVIAFASTTAALLTVVGGCYAFLGRAGAPRSLAGFGAIPFDGTGMAAQYPVLAAVASLLILIPLVTLGGAAARLAVARRDSRLAALRLAGATGGQVRTVTVLDALTQAVGGAVLGVAAYGALLPLVARLRFQGRAFDVAELWVGAPTVAAAVGVVVLVALVSALASLRRVTISPLGVAARTTPPALHWVRMLALGACFVAMLVVTTVSFGSEGLALVLVLGVLLAGFATMNLVGPFVVWLTGRATAAQARSVATLLAGRRMADAPKNAWRSVGGVALATFIAGLASILALGGGDPSMSAADRQLLTDLNTGAMLTLGIAGLLAAVSTGVMQAGRVIDQRAEYRALALAGTDRRTLDAARLRETLIPLTAAVGTATVCVLLFMVPVIGLGTVINLAVVAQYLLSVAGAVALVLAGAASSRWVARAVA